MLSLARNMFIFKSKKKKKKKKKKSKSNSSPFTCRSYRQRKEKYLMVAMEIQNNLKDIFRVSLNGNLICLDIS